MNPLYINIRLSRHYYAYRGIKKCFPKYTTTGREIKINEAGHNIVPDLDIYVVGCKCSYEEISNTKLNTILVIVEDINHRLFDHIREHAYKYDASYLKLMTKIVGLHCKEIISWIHPEQTGDSMKMFKDIIVHQYCEEFNIPCFNSGYKQPYDWEGTKKTEKFCDWIVSKYTLERIHEVFGKWQELETACIKHAHKLIDNHEMKTKLEAALKNVTDNLDKLTPFEQRETC